jgi:hypothetical protein
LEDRPAAAPFPVDDDTLFVAFYDSAEFGCYLELGWETPTRILDLYVEFRNLTNGLYLPDGSGLLGALAYFGIPGISAMEKKEWQDLAIRGGPYSEAERRGLMDYCQTDVDVLAPLLRAMLPKIDWPRALFRGRFMLAAARMERSGIPIDVPLWQRISANFGRMQSRLIREVNKLYNVYAPTGQRQLNPANRLDFWILQEAKASGIDPHRLANAVDEVWRQEREVNKEVFAARKAARDETGLTQRRINAWEDSGRDYSEWPGLDDTARVLARQYPALGIGAGYTDDGGEDRTDYAGQLWGLLRNHDERHRPKYDPDTLRQAVEMVLAAGEDEDFRPLSFSTKRFEAYLIRNKIPWPYLPTGKLDLDDDTFGEMARLYPKEIGPLRELRHSLSQLRLRSLTIGRDGRNRYMLSAFRSITSRNQPSNSHSIFGPSTFLRSLIKPPEGRAIAYLDWSAQELGIAAKYSNDPVMQAAYQGGDPHLYLAKQAGAVPEDATKKSHPEIRERFKVASLGVLFGLSEYGLARKLDMPKCYAKEILDKHRSIFRQFWKWSDAVEEQGMLMNLLHTVFGWTLHVADKANPRSLRNFPMQSGGAEMLRLACCLATERGITVCAPIHDALLVEAAEEDIEEVVRQTQDVMREASEIVLDGFPLRSEAKVVRYPDRYVDERGAAMWEVVMRLLGQEEDSLEVPLEMGSSLPIGVT